MKRTREEIMSKLQTIVGEDTSDEVLEFVQDVSDTIGDDTSAQRIAELEQQIETNDKEWRRKYRDAFFTGKTEEIEEDIETEKPKRFEDLFTTN